MFGENQLNRITESNKKFRIYCHLYIANQLIISYLFLPISLVIGTPFIFVYNGHAILFHMVLVGQAGLEPATALSTDFTDRGDTNYTVLTHIKLCLAIHMSNLSFGDLPVQLSSRAEVESLRHFPTHLKNGSGAGTWSL